MSASAAASPVTYGVAARPAAGEDSCGDQAVIARTERGALLAVIDGLGHGPDAEATARGAAEVLTRHAGAQPVELLHHCHRALPATRGAAISLVDLTAGGRADWLAVGNVAGTIRRAGGGATTRLVTRGGIVGLRLPTLRTTRVTLVPGDLLVLCTDGVDEAATRDLPVTGEPQTLARVLLDRFATGIDDALVLAARYEQVGR